MASTCLAWRPPHSDTRTRTGFGTHGGNRQLTVFQIVSIENTQNFSFDIRVPGDDEISRKFKVLFQSSPDLGNAGQNRIRGPFSSDNPFYEAGWLGKTSSFPFTSSTFGFPTIGKILRQTLDTFSDSLFEKLV